LNWQQPGGTEENTVNLDQCFRCPSGDSNREYPECNLAPLQLKPVMFLESKVRLVRSDDNLTAIYEPIV
jgi:hypothetical protein